MTSPPSPVLLCLQRSKPCNATNLLLLPLLLAFPPTRSLTSKAVILWVSSVVCIVAPLTMCSKVARRNMLLALALRSSNISSRTSLTSANDPLFLQRFYQPTPVLLSRNPFRAQPVFHHNPFRAQPVFHPLFHHASVLHPLRLFLRNVPSSSFKLSSHSLCILFDPVPCSGIPLSR